MSALALRRPSRPVVAIAALLGLAGCSSGEGSSAPSGGATAKAADAVVWGYPLVVTRRTLQTFAAIVGTNSLFSQPVLANASTRLIVSPNQDTLYSVAVLRLQAEPMVLTVPDVHDRYWTYQLLDAWTTSFHYLGTRATGGKGGCFVITAPGWKGEAPAGCSVIAAPTPEVFVLGRYLVAGAGDVKNVNALDRRLEPLSKVMGTAAPAPLEPIGTAPGKPQDVGATGGDFFDELGDALALDPPATEADAAAARAFEAIGVGAGRHPYEGADAAGREALDAAVREGLSRIVAAADAATSDERGWAVRLDVGRAPDDVLLRAAVANFAWGINVPEEAVYASAGADAQGAAFTGARDWTVHFAPGALPPVDPEHGFWSVTLYGPDHFFVDNPLGRFAIGDRTEGLVKNADGSLDLYVQHAAPAGHEPNWLPAPAGPFLLMLRMYLPGEPVLDGSYAYPTVVAR